MLVLPRRHGLVQVPGTGRPKPHPTCGAGGTSPRVVIENTQENLRQWIEDPQSIKQGTIMFRDAKVYTDPERKLSDADVAALVAYLQTLK